MVEIRFPDFLTGSLLAPARQLIDACPTEYRQPILDEIGAIHATGKVSYLIGLLRSLIERARAGRFVPNRSVGRSPRSSQSPIGTRILKPQSSPAGQLTPSSEIGRQTISRLREQLKLDGS